MLYSIYINQPKMIERDLTLTQACVMNFVMQLSTWCQTQVIDGEVYYYLAAGKLVEELPGVSTTKRSYYNILKKLRNKGLLEHKNYKNKGHYRITDKGKEWNIKEYHTQKDSSKDDKVSLTNDKGVTHGGHNYNTNDYNTNNIYKEIYEKRLEAGIIEHRKLTNTMKKEIDKKLEEFTKEEIIEGIEKYGKVLDSDKAFFSYRRTLHQFLKRDGGFETFIDKDVSDWYDNKNRIKKTTPSKDKNSPKHKKNKLKDIGKMKEALLGK